ncbi:MAG: hypothetical protein JJT85_02895 [Chromatiales bacterium]|nr:hypothetical protein [Chromatiales bacterium]
MGHLTTLGGELDGQPYQGTLAARCEPGVRCQVTPFTSAFVALQDRDQLDYAAARLAINNRIGLQFDPFAEADSVPPGVFDLAALRSFLDRGSLLSLWIQDLLAWLDDSGSPVPAGVFVGTPGPGPGGPAPAPDPACTDFEVVVDEPHYLVDSHAAMVAALQDPENRADGRLVIGITGDIDDGPDGPAVNPMTSVGE